MSFRPSGAGGPAGSAPAGTGPPPTAESTCASCGERRWSSTFHLDYPDVRDPTNATSRKWGATGIPETYFVSANGKVVGHIIGTVTAHQLDDGVAAALSGRPRGADQGGEQRPTR